MPLLTDKLANNSFILGVPWKSQQVVTADIGEILSVYVTFTEFFFQG